MIVVLSGVTGVGKSYLKSIIQDKLNLENLLLVTTRAKREGEIEGKDKYFFTIDEYNKKKQTGEIAVTFNFLGENYAYYTKDLLNNKNSIVELHYATITEFKKVAKQVLAIYILPNDINIAIEQLKKRNLPKKVEEKRISEIKEQYYKVKTNKNILKEFDYIIENDYTQKVVEKIVGIINKHI